MCGMHGPDALQELRLTLKDNKPALLVGFGTLTPKQGLIPPLVWSPLLRRSMQNLKQVQSRDRA